MSRSAALRLVAYAALAGVALAIVFGVRSSQVFGDSAAYWAAAERLRSGAELYRGPGAIFDATSYHYAPWFAFAWVPLTYLPRGVVDVTWVAILVAAAVLSLLRANRYLAAALAPMLAWSALTGNVHALLVAALVFTVDRRSGPVMIGIAASLKILPIVYVAVYIGRRQWAAAGVALGTAALLWLPALLLNVSFPAEVGGTISLYTLVGPIPFAVVALVAIGVAVFRPTWLAGSIAVVLSLPRLLLYDFSYLLVGAPRRAPLGLARTGSQR